MDAWALGVVAFELLTGQSALNLITEGRDSVCLSDASQGMSGSGSLTIMCSCCAYYAALYTPATSALQARVTTAMSNNLIKYRTCTQGCHAQL